MFFFYNFRYWLCTTAAVGLYCNPGNPDWLSCYNCNNCSKSTYQTYSLSKGTLPSATLTYCLSSAPPARSRVLKYLACRKNTL